MSFAGRVAAFCLLFLGSTAAEAQFGPVPGVGGVGNLGDQSPIAVRAVVVAAADGQPPRLAVTADMQPGWNTYSITQPPGGQVRTQIKVAPSPQFTVGEFRSVQEPTIHPEPAYDNLLAEEHRGSVTWYAPLTLAPDVDVAKLEIQGAVFAQACNEGCIAPKDYPFTAKVGAPPIALPAIAKAAAAPPAVSTAPPVPQTLSPDLAIPGIAPPLPTEKTPPVAPTASVGTYATVGTHVKWNARLEPAVVAPGGKARLLFTADIEPQWHVYAVDAPQATGNQATIFAITSAGDLKVGPPVPDREPIPAHGAAILPGSKLLPYFETQVTWALDVEVPADAVAGQSMLIAGVLGFQTCKDMSQCDAPKGVRFDVPVTIAAAGEAGSVQPVRFVEPQHYKSAVAALSGTPLVASVDSSSAPIAPPATAPTTDYDVTKIEVQHAQQTATTLPVMLLTGLLAGFILNFMPCVLPVIGLKVLSFVEQGGHDRRRILMLNVWYALGIISVFWILATIPVVLRLWFNTQFGWGQQFSYDGFNITLAAVVFVMALSFLGVWEIPIPGFAGGRNAQQIASKEGAGGAFAKGVLTTVLATPCSGPFLGTAVAFALTSSTGVTYAMFTAMGLGMAAPYLLIGAQPRLIRFLPKPGEWMDTFKQLMGFVLIGTVIWLLLPIHESILMPTLVLLAGLSAACWWIGRTPGYAELPHKLKAWGQATVFAVLIGWFAFGWFGDASIDNFHASVDAENSRRLREYHSTEIPPAARVRDPAAVAWQQFSLPQFVADVDSGKTVMLQFTAKWCATCKTLKALNLNRASTKEVIDKLGVVPYEIDIDELPPEEYALYQKLVQGGGVPLIAIFPAGKRYQPINFQGAYTQGEILDALDQAGPSRPTNAVAGRDGVSLGMQ